MKKVFIIHGWTYSLNKWGQIVQDLKQAGIEPELLKVPGLTESSNKSWTIDEYVEWLGSKLKGVKDPVVIGHSNGGRITLSYIQKHPHTIKQLILIDSAGLEHNEKKSLFKLKALRIISKIGKVFGYVPLVKKVFYKLIGAQDYLNASPQMKVTMQNMLESDKLIDLSKIKLPTTIIWGREDRVTPLSDAERLHEGIAGSKLIVVDGARHSPFFTHHTVVAGLIEVTLKGNS